MMVTKPCVEPVVFPMANHWSGTEKQQEYHLNFKSLSHLKTFPNLIFV